MSRKIKILFTIPNFVTAGSGREMFNIIEHLDKQMFDPWIATMKEGGALYDEIIAKGYPVIVKKFNAEKESGLLQKLRTIWQLSKGFKQYGFDLWQSFHWSSDFTEALVARFSGARYLYVKKNMNWDRNAWKIKSFLSSGVVVRNSTLMETQFAPGYLRKRAFFITGGVDIRRFSTNVQTAIRRELNIPEDATMISCIAQLVKLKDQATLIKAVSRVRDVYLVLAGAQRDVEYLNDLKSLIAELNIADRVLLPGSISKVNELLKATDIFVLPTSKMHGHEEGCPVALLEAMACGVPCIASDVAGSRDLVIHEKTGLLFEPGNVEDLTACIQKYISDSAIAKKYAKNAYEKVLSAHTLEIEANSFANIYGQLAGIK